MKKNDIKKSEAMIALTVRIPESLHDELAHRLIDDRPTSANSLARQAFLDYVAGKSSQSNSGTDVVRSKKGRTLEVSAGIFDVCEFIAGLPERKGDPAAAGLWNMLVAMARERSEGE